MIHRPGHDGFAAKHFNASAAPNAIALFDLGSSDLVVGADGHAACAFVELGRCWMGPKRRVCRMQLALRARMDLGAAMCASWNLGTMLSRYFRWAWMLGLGSVAGGIQIEHS